MEILTGRSSVVTYLGEPGWTATASWDQNGESKGALTVTSSSGTYSVTIPYQMYESDIVVHWNFNIPGVGAVTRDEHLEMATPLLTNAQVRTIVEDDTLTGAELDEIERGARLIIQAHTGQTFGKFVGTKSVTGGGDTVLRLPARLVKLDSVNDVTTFNNALAVRGNGWYLVSKNYGGYAPPVRADFHGWNEATGPIVAPYSMHPMAHFNQHVEYTIEGTWGWEAVPIAVAEAAKLLVNDYACGDSLYRDRFLTSMTAADWRIQFHEGAFSNTGNVRANQLLAAYVLHRGWMVI